MNDKNKSDEKKQHKDFDRIFRENAVPVFLPLIEMQLGFKIKSFKELPTALPKTSDRDIDALYQIENEDSKVEILHIEFQSKSDSTMLKRTAEYHGMIYRKYGLPIRHVVIFLGKGKANMKTQLLENEIFRGFDLINLHELDADKLLSSQVPEVILLALLADFGKERTEGVLRLLALRKLETITSKMIKDMPIIYNEKEHYLYQQGMMEEREKSERLIEQEREKFEQALEQALEQEREKSTQELEKARLNKIMAIKGFLNLDTISKEQIAMIYNVEIEYVEQIERGEIS